MPPCHRADRALAVLPLLLVLAGCFTVDATIEADGSGHLTLSYVPGHHATIDSETARFTSPHVTVRSVVPIDTGARLDADFDDVTQLATAEGFGMVSVVRGRRGRREALRIVIRNPRPHPFEDRGQPGPRLTLTLPGPVLASSRDADIDGNRIAWELPLTEYVEQPSISVSVRWRADATAGG